MYYVTDYFTNEVITCTDSFEIAKKLCDMHEGSQVVTESGDYLYLNIELPF